MQGNFTIVKELSIPSTFDYIPKIESLVEFICSKLGIDDGFGNVLIAVSEAVNNAIIHGNKNNSEAYISIQLAESDNLFYFSVEDQGSGFDYGNFPDPTLVGDINQESGRGIFLIRNLADSVEFEKNGRKITIYFSKNHFN